MGQEEKNENVEEGSESAEGAQLGIADNKFLFDLENILSKLDPQREVVISDVYGKEVTVNAFVSARKQIKIFKKLKEISEMNFDLGVLTGISEGNIVTQLITIASNEEIAEQLGELFKIAYPDLYEDPLDSLPIEELVTAIFPFFLRFFKKIAGTMMGVMGQQPKN